MFGHNFETVLKTLCLKTDKLFKIEIQSKKIETENKPRIKEKAMKKPKKNRKNVESKTLNQILLKLEKQKEQK